MMEGILVVGFLSSFLILSTYYHKKLPVEVLLFFMILSSVPFGKNGYLLSFILLVSLLIYSFTHYGSKYSFIGFVFYSAITPYYIGIEQYRYFTAFLVVFISSVYIVIMIHRFFKKKGDDPNLRRAGIIFVVTEFLFMSIITFESSTKNPITLSILLLLSILIGALLYLYIEEKKHAKIWKVIVSSALLLVAVIYFDVGEIFYGGLFVVSALLSYFDFEKYIDWDEIDKSVLDLLKRI